MQAASVEIESGGLKQTSDLPGNLERLLVG